MTMMWALRIIDFQIWLLKILSLFSVESYLTMNTAVRTGGSGQASSFSGHAHDDCLQLAISRRFTRSPVTPFKPWSPRKALAACPNSFGGTCQLVDLCGSGCLPVGGHICDCFQFNEIKPYINHTIWNQGDILSWKWNKSIAHCDL